MPEGSRRPAPTSPEILEGWANKRIIGESQDFDLRPRPGRITLSVLCSRGWDLRCQCGCCRSSIFTLSTSAASLHRYLAPFVFPTSI
ncbi:hypothetical protein I7I50_00808 [Histoplasma capsulatum G186AR]|uniref:Uncharacterized protein n=1 Tax=Ajellomyces capsulatus TaxID=5037 RepID=A0A8H8CUD9_AJECA|nr:hypothetical protein I7I52_08076 [Histoplasma capsulatum]QSS72838.1 hypothetical protein I7I50_00808 [Histoplasma capsulatum G186AR]